MGFCSLHRSRVKNNVCDYQLNKVNKIYLISVNDLDKFKINGSGIDGCGSELISATTISNRKLWTLIEPSDNTASYTDTLMINDNGTKYKQHQLNFSIGGQYDANAVCDVDALALGEYIAVVKLTSGNQVCLGDVTTPLTASSVVTTQPSSPTEFNGVQIEMTADALHSVVPVATNAMEYITEHLQSTKDSAYAVFVRYVEGSETIYAQDNTLRTSDFENKDEITEIEIMGEGITRIGDECFYEFPNLKIVKIQPTITYLGQAAFSSNPSLSKVYYNGSQQQFIETVKTVTPMFYNCGISCIDTTFDGNTICDD